MGRPSIAYLNECRAIRRQTGVRKSRWKAPKVAPTAPRRGERISRSYAVTLAVRYHLQRQAEIAQAKHLVTLDDIPF